MYGSETWPMKVEHELKLNRTEMRLDGCVGLRWMKGRNAKNSENS